MNDDLLPSRARSFGLEALLVCGPLAAALLGFVVRYAAYAAVIPGASLAAFVDDLCRWDCQWYVRIAESGYDSFPVATMVNAGNWAFFPLYPMLVGGLRLVTGLPTMVVATTLSLVISLASARLAWPLLGRDLRAYALFSCYLLCGPFSIYFTTFYTEVLFLFLAVAVFVALRKRCFLLAGALAGLLSATRIVGVFIVFALLFEFWRVHRDEGGNWRNFVPVVLGRPDWLLALFLAPSGLFAYMAFLHVQVGDAFAFSHVQRAWARPMGDPLAFVWNALSNVPQAGWLPTVSQQLAAATLAGYMLLAMLVSRRRYGMAIFSAFCLTLPLFAGMASMLRFVAGLAPMPLMLCEFVLERRWLWMVVIVAFPAAGFFAAIGWLQGALTLV